MFTLKRRFTALAAGALLAGSLAAAPVAAGKPAPPANGLSAHQQSVLRSIAKDTWKFFAADVDPTTHLPLDNLGPGTTRGEYTSAGNISDGPTPGGPRRWPRG